eukprot:761286-Hanusia_phi.AAC.3
MDENRLTESELAKCIEAAALKLPVWSSVDSSQSRFRGHTETTTQHAVDLMPPVKEHRKHVN